MSKLTLHVPDELVAAAKREAAERETSVSKLVSDYFRLFAVAEKDEGSQCDGELSPLTKSLVGCAKGATEGVEDYVDHLEKKHS